VAPPRCTSRRWVVRPLAELTTSPLAPSVAIRGGCCIAAASPSPRIARPAPAAVSSKTTASSDQDAFHRRVLPPPVAHGACAHARGITRSPPPARCSRAVAFATANRLPAPLRALSGRLSARRQRARPAVFRPLDRAPLVDFCNQTQPASTTAKTTRFPPRCLRLVLPRRRPAGSAAWRRFRSRGPVHVAGSKGRALAGQGPSPSQWLHDDGPPLAFARGALAVPRMTLSGRMTSELYPTRIRSDTSRRESTAPSTGEFDDARRPPGGGDTAFTLTARAPPRYRAELAGHEGSACAGATVA